MFFSGDGSGDMWQFLGIVGESLSSFLCRHESP